MLLSRAKRLSPAPVFFLRLRLRHVHPAYVKAAKTANTLIKQARKKFEDCLAKKIKDDRKSFFALCQTKKQK